MSDKNTCYSGLDQEELAAVAANAEKHRKEAIDLKLRKLSLQESQYLAENLMSNSDIASRIIKSLKQTTLQAAKSGQRQMRIAQLQSEDFIDPIHMSGTLEETHGLRRGSVSELLSKRLLEAGFKLELEIDTISREPVLIMRW